MTSIFPLLLFWTAESSYDCTAFILFSLCCVYRIHCGSLRCFRQTWKLSLRCSFVAPASLSTKLWRKNSVFYSACCKRRSVPLLVSYTSVILYLQSFMSILIYVYDNYLLQCYVLQSCCCVFLHIRQLNFSWVLWHCWLGIRKSIRPVKTNKSWSAGMVISLEQVQNICLWSSWGHCHPVISCIVKIQIGLTFLVPAYPSCPGKEAVLHSAKWTSSCIFRWCDYTCMPCGCLCVFVPVATPAALCHWPAHGPLSVATCRC